MSTPSAQHIFTVQNWPSTDVCLESLSGIVWRIIPLTTWLIFTIYSIKSHNFMNTYMHAISYTISILNVFFADHIISITPCNIFTGVLSHHIIILHHSLSYRIHQKSYAIGRFPIFLTIFTLGQWLKVAQYSSTMEHLGFCQLIGLREKSQENHIFHGKIYGFL